VTTTFEPQLSLDFFCVHMRNDVTSYFAAGLPAFFIFEAIVDSGHSQREHCLVVIIPEIQG